MNPVRPRPLASVFAAQAEFIAGCGGVEVVARFANRSPSTVYRWTDPDQSEGMPLGVAGQLTEHFGAPQLAEHMAARAGGVFLPIPSSGGPARWGELTAEAAEDMGRTTADIVRALSPASEDAARVSRREALQILADIDRVMRDLAALRTLASQAAAEE